MTAPNTTPQIPSRDDPGTTRCPVCEHGFTPVGRQAYCSTACRKTAFRRRHHQPGPVIAVPAARPRRQITIYECPDCGERALGEQRCDSCHTFTPPRRHRRELPRTATNPSPSPTSSIRRRSPPHQRQPTE
jgi:hypothetical protein